MSAAEHPGGAAAPCGAQRVTRSSRGVASGTRRESLPSHEPPAWRRDNCPQQTPLMPGAGWLHCPDTGKRGPLQSSYPYILLRASRPPRPSSLCKRTTFPDSLCLPTAFSEKNQLCWARAKDKGTAKHLPAGASAPLLLSPAEAPGEQLSIGRKQHFWSASKTLPRGHFS